MTQGASDHPPPTWVAVHLRGFPGGLAVKNPPANAGDPGSVSGSGRSPGERNGNTLQYPCLERIPWTEEGAWRATVHEVARSQTRLSIFHSLTVTGGMRAVFASWAVTKVTNQGTQDRSHSSSPSSGVEKPEVKKAAGSCSLQNLQRWVLPCLSPASGDCWPFPAPSTCRCETPISASSVITGCSPSACVSVSDQNLCFTATFVFIVVVWTQTHSNLQGLPVSVYPMEEGKDFLAF